MLVRPPEEPADTDGRPVVFLAGPIQGAAPWQETVAAALSARVPGAVVASPRRPVFDDSSQATYEEQVAWECRWLRRAGRHGVVSFWLADQADIVTGRAYAQTTRYELGEWVARAAADPSIRLAVGIAPGFTGARYVRLRLAADLPHVRITDSPDAHVDTIAALLPRERTGR